jgi:MoaA/NifB/PqqE/SkfB family radical SAM enzyme
MSQCRVFGYGDIHRLVDPSVFEHSVEVELTNRCNADCVFCPRSEQLRPIGNMSEEVFAGLVDRFDRDGISHISLNGYGEPTSHPSYVEFAEALRARLPATELSTTTNGSLLRPDMMRRMLDGVFNKITLSWWGWDRASYEETMLRLRFDRVHANLRELVQMRRAMRSRTDVEVCLVRTVRSQADLERTVAFLLQEGIRNFCILTAHNRANLLRDETIWRTAAEPDSEQDDRAAADDLCSRRSMVIRFVDWMGRIHQCCNDIQDRALIGDAREMSIQEATRLAADNYWRLKDTFCVGCTMPRTLKLVEFRHYS